MTTITISGAPGTGTTTIAKLLKQHLALPHVYAGALFREKAEEYHMSLEEFGRFCESHPEIDKELDAYQVEILKKGQVILEGRLAGWLAYRNNVPAVKILLQASIDIRAQRLVKREQGTVRARKEEIQKREKSEQKRYKNFYGINLSDTSIYDLVIDTSHQTPEEILQCILDYVND